MPGVLVTLYSRVGCHLCTDARAVVQRVCDQTHTPWREVDVDSDPALRARFTDHVPVTFVGDRQLSMWFLDEDQLRSALSAQR